MFRVTTPGEPETPSDHLAWPETASAAAGRPRVASWAQLAGHRSLRSLSRPVGAARSGVVTGPGRQVRSGPEGAGCHSCPTRHQPDPGAPNRRTRHRAPRHVAAALLRRSPPWSAELLWGARQLASRARRRVKGADLPAPGPDWARQRAWSTPPTRRRVGATSMPLAWVLDPDVVLRDQWGARRRGRPGDKFSHPAAQLRPADHTGPPACRHRGRRPFVVMGFTVTEGRFAEIECDRRP